MKNELNAVTNQQNVISTVTSPPCFCGPLVRPLELETLYFILEGYIKRFCGSIT